MSNTKESHSVPPRPATPPPDSGQTPESDVPQESPQAPEDNNNT
jgi:hypothetical protein